MAAWVWDTGPMREALARLDFQAVLVIYRSAAGVTRRELGERTGLSESVIWYWEAPAARHLRHPPAPAVRGRARMPRLALLPVILGQPDALSDLLADQAATALAACAGAAGHG